MKFRLCFLLNLILESGELDIEQQVHVRSSWASITKQTHFLRRCNFFYKQTRHVSVHFWSYFQKLWKIVQWKFPLQHDTGFPGRRSHSSVCNRGEKFHPNVIFMDKMSVDLVRRRSKWLYLINMALRTTFTGHWTWQQANVMKFFQPKSIEEEISVCRVSHIAIRSKGLQFLGNLHLQDFCWPAHPQLGSMHKKII